jgi:hypothetical protein
MKFRTKVKEIDAIQYDGTNAVAVLKFISPYLDITMGPLYVPEKYTEAAFADYFLKEKWNMKIGYWVWTNGVQIFAVDNELLFSEYEGVY